VIGPALAREDEQPASPHEPRPSVGPEPPMDTHYLLAPPSEARAKPPLQPLPCLSGCQVRRGGQPGPACLALLTV